MNSMDILEALERGELSAVKAAALLKKLNSPHSAENMNSFQKLKMQMNQNTSDKKEKLTAPAAKTRRGHWLKIQVKDDNVNLRFYVPIFILSFGLFLGDKVIKSRYLAEKKNGSDNDGLKTAQNILGSISGHDRRQLVKALRCGGGSDIVKVNDGDTKVVISII